MESAYFSYTETCIICIVLFFQFKFVAQCNLLLLKTFFSEIACKSHNFEDRTMKCVLLRSKSLTLQILWIEFCNSEMLWEICVVF